MKSLLRSIATLLCLFAVAPLVVADSHGHKQPVTLSPLEIASGVEIIPNQTYLKADGIDLKLDVYRPRTSTAEPAQPVPTVVFFHGGGWIGGSKERSAMGVLTYLEKGWAAVNVQYRLGGTALAPAAVQDARCALRWVKNNAAKYGFDADQIVLTGRSAGGHLALITGMLPSSAGLDELCPGALGGSGLDRALSPVTKLDVAAIVNWAGITDVNDLVSGPNATAYARAWLGGQPDWEAIAKRVSPLTYVRKGLPPILTLHGDQDQIVPFAHATQLHKALDRKGVANQLHVIEGKEHFNFDLADNKAAAAVIDKFLAEHLSKSR